MLDIQALYQKIEYLKNEIIPDSISPMRLGSILHEMLEQIKESYRQGLGEDLEDIVIEANLTLEKARIALETLTIAIQKLEESLRVVVVDRGIYDPEATYFFETLNPATGIIETSDVWYYGCRYRCLVTGTKQTPGWKSTEWLLIEGNNEFTVEFAPFNTVVTIHNININLRIIARLNNIDITDDIIASDVEWSRYSEDADGVERALSDKVWNMAHASGGKQIHITLADIDYDGRIPKVVRFTATVTLRDAAYIEPRVAAAALSLTNL